jgi:hypothetical protein
MGSVAAARVRRHHQNGKVKRFCLKAMHSLRCTKLPPVVWGR